MSKFGRNDIKDFIRNFKEASWSDESGGFRLLSECGCEDAEESVYDAVAIDQPPSALGVPEESIIEPNPILPELFGPVQEQGSWDAPCPDSYNTAADLIVQIPEEVIEMLQPLMQQLGIGCPASLAKAMGDVLTVSQENGITPVFNTEEPLL